jgi:ribosomal protein RSM22 (predicted rRNA methylase)
VLALDVSQADFDQQIKTILDQLLRRKTIYKRQGFIIEDDTKYAQQLKNVAANFTAIRRIAVNEYQPIKNDRIFHSLNRGVAILDQEPQLYSYLNSYGPMHYQKVYHALAELPEHIFAKNALVYDWGCGQGIASLALLDYMTECGIKRKINSVTLIEPSEIALKRAALHIKKLDGITDITTVHKDMDSLTGEDLINRHDDVKFHLLSNIIDVDYFSLAQLIALIKETFSGVNYFICASPYIDELKLSRMNSFCDAFAAHQNFEMFSRVNNKKGEWVGESIGDWTRMIRVFKVNL